MEIGLVAADGGRLAGKPLMEPLFPPLGLMTVASLTGPEHNVSIYDESIASLDFDAEPDILGLSAMTAAAGRAYQIADHFRGRGIPVVMGGMHASALPEEALQHVDAVVVGEAEGLWPQLLKDFEAGEMRPVYRHEDFPDPRSIPPARRDIVDVDKYVAKGTLQATRGCPFACHFCTVTEFFGGSYRTRPVESVIDEAASIKNDPLIFVDDNIMGEPEYAHRLLDALSEAGRPFLSQASTSIVRMPGLVAKAAQAGCRALFVGLESISPAALAHIGKKFNPVARYRELVQLLHDNGIAIIGAFMFGVDGDDPEVFQRTVEFAEEANIDVAQFSVLTPLPGTKLYHELDSQGRITDRDWTHYDASHVTFEPQGMTAEQLDAGFRWAYERFYSWGSVTKRAVRRRDPLLWLANVTFHKRVRKWLARTAS